VSRRSILTALIDDPVPFLDHHDAEVRRLAVSAAQPHAAGLVAELSAILRNDPDPLVRAEAAEVIAAAGPAALPALDEARDDEDERVVEAVVTGYGEVAEPAPVEWLIAQAEHAESRQVQEAAVAALGAIGDERARPVLIALVDDGPPQVRRRAVVALTVFDGDDVEAAIRRAAADRNPMVREAAQMVVGREAGGS
jgi:HEAT repeat protein